MATKITDFDASLIPVEHGEDQTRAPISPRLTKEEEAAEFKRSGEHQARAKALGISTARLDTIEYAAEVAAKLRSGDKHFVLLEIRKIYDTYVDGEREWCNQFADTDGIADTDFSTPTFKELLARPAGARRDKLIAKLDAHAAIVLGNQYGYVARVAQGRFDPDIWCNVALLFASVEQIAKAEESPLLMPAVEHDWLYGKGKKPADPKCWYTRAEKKRQAIRNSAIAARADAETKRWAELTKPAAVTEQAQEAADLDDLNAGIDSMLMGLIKRDPEPEAEPKPDTQTIADHALQVLTAPTIDDVEYAGKVLARLKAGQAQEIEFDSREDNDIDSNPLENTAVVTESISTEPDNTEQIDFDSTAAPNSEDDALLALFNEFESIPESQSQAV